MMLLAGCGADDDDDVGGSDDAAEEETGGDSDEATDDATDEGDETTDDDGTDEGDGDGETDEGDVLCTAVDISGGEELTLAEAEDPQTEALFTDVETGCDEAANRPIENSATSNTASDVQQTARKAAYPGNVVAHPDECAVPSNTSAPEERKGRGTVAAEIDGEEFWAIYTENELLSFVEPDDVIAEIEALADELGVDAPVVVRAAELDDGRDELEVPGVSALAGSYPAEFQAAIEGEVLYRLAIDLDGADDDGIFDPLVLSNLLTGRGVLVRPNYVAVRTPGSQHSPANEPVPLDPAGLLVPDQAADGSTQIAVAVLDSDVNASDSPMTLSAGHLTFVVGVIQQLTDAASITQIAFEAGYDIGASPDPTDWDLLRIAQDEDLASSVSLVNLSLGAYSCRPPLEEMNIDEPLPGLSDAPLGLVGLVATLQQADVTIAAAAGNDGQGRPFWPAALADYTPAGDNVIGVKALDPSTGNVASFSNQLPDNAACATGVDVRSTYPTGRYAYSVGGFADFDGAAIWSGTSFATPHITAEYVNLRAGGMTAADAITALRGNNCP